MQDFDTHHVIGQEFDRVVMILDYNFYYNQDSGILHARNHPSNDYLFGQLFFQGITRVREKLALVVVGNYELFKDIIKILA